MNTRQLIYSHASSISRSLKNLQDWSRGYSKDFADFRRSPDSYEFRFTWGQCVTPLKVPVGSDDIHFSRCRDMKAAIEFVSGVVLEPGKIFSFWDQVPKPTRKNGFRAESPTLIRGQLDSYVGGGMCQVSTALFGAFLRANLEVIERHNHRFDIHGENRFFHLGQDAIVNYGHQDLLVRNPTSVSLLVRVKLNRSLTTLTASVVAAEPSLKQVKLTSKIIESLPASHPQGRPGWLVETQRFAAPAASPGSDTADSDIKEEDWQMNYQFVSRYKPFNPVASQTVC